MGPKVLTPEEISRYVDGELSESEQREIEYQAEAYTPSRKKLEEHKTAADQIANLFQEVILNDPAYRTFVQMVEDFEPRTIDTDIEAIRKLIPDPDRLKQILDQLASDFYATTSDLSMSMMSLKSASSSRDSMESFATNERRIDPSRVGLELARHLDEFVGINELFTKVTPKCRHVLSKLERTVATLQKIRPVEADPEIAVATVCIEQLIKEGLPGAKIMMKIIQGESVFKRDYQLAIREISLFIELNR